LDSDRHGIVRIALSGLVEREAALHASGMVHPYLSKPCDPDALRNENVTMGEIAPIIAQDVGMTAKVQSPRLAPRGS
jgi:hypothetical protein